MYNTMENSLYHHGIDGQKWGQRNGPPYPLKRGIAGVIQKRKYNQEQKKKEKAEENHEKLVNTGSAKAIQRHKGEFTDEELNKIYNRLNAEKKINEIAANETKNTVESVKNYLSTAVSTATSGVQMYNLMAYINNSVTGDSAKKWPVINTNPQSETAKKKAQAELVTAQANARKAKAEANKAEAEYEDTPTRLANENAQRVANTEQTRANADSTRARAESTRSTTARAEAEASRAAKTYENTYSYTLRTAAANARKAEADARTASANATKAKAEADDIKKKNKT